jgi:hypothetical protein
MSASFSVSESTSFTVTHARHMAAKVATDLKRMQRLYGSPSDPDIADYETEVVELLKAGYLNTVWYGYRRDEKWIEPTLRYTAKDLAGTSANDDDPGRIRSGANITYATFYSYLTRTSAWHSLSSEQRQMFEKSLPFQRGGAPEPSVNGYLSPDRTYSAGGRALSRDSVRSW